MPETKNENNTNDINDIQDGLTAEKYYQACHLMSETAYAGSDCTEAIAQLERLVELFKELGDYSDCEERLEKCSRRLEKLKEKKAEDDRIKTENDKKLRAEYQSLREEAERAEKILKKRDAARRLEEISQVFLSKYSSIEGASDYAREYSERSKVLQAAYIKRRKYEIICCVAAAAVCALAAVIYILTFAKQGRDYRPLIPLCICDSLMIATFMIGYHCESDSGTLASVTGAAGAAACFIATVLLSIFKRPPLGFLGYIWLLLLPIVIGFTAGAVLYITWGIFARRVEKPGKTRWEKKSRKDMK